MEDYQKYRWFYTSSNKLVVGGKSAKQNDQLLKKMKSQETDYTVLHTEAPGSPFAVILTNKPSTTDIKETATFTASFSRLWKTKKSSASVHAFKLSQLSKPKTAKEGTWSVSGSIKKIKALLKLHLKKQKSVLRAVPFTKGSKLTITPGTIKKDDMLPKLEIELNLELTKDEVLSALPSGPFKITR